MSLHKIRPRLKNYSKTKIFLKNDQQKNLVQSKKKLLNMFSPDVRYLNSK
jgi:hypothetical protein